MDQEEKAYEWAEKIAKSCPGIESLTRTEFKQMYKGSMKTVLDAMAKHLRSSEDAETARIKTRMMQMRELSNKKKILELEIIKLQNKKEESLKILNTLELKKAAVDSSLEETRNEVSFFKAYANQSDNQCKAVQGLQQITQDHGHKMSPTVLNSESTNSRSAPSSFIFNPDNNKLESLLKVETRKLMTELSPHFDMDVAATGATQMISKYSGEERWKTLLDLQRELTSEAAKMSEDVNLKKDAENLSKELENVDADTDVIRPLQRHLDTLILEHAALMLTRLHRDREINALQLQLKDLYNPDDETEKKVQDAIKSAQTAKLQKNLAKLISQNRQEFHSQSEITRKILQIRNFNQETEIRKNKIIHLMTSIQSASQQAVQQKTKNEQRAQEVNADFEAFSQLPDIMQGQLTLLSEQQLTTFFEKLSPTWQVASNSDKTAPHYQMILKIIYEIEKTKNQLRILQNVQEVTQRDDAAAVDSHGEKSAIEKASQSIEKEKQALQQKIVELKQHLDLEQEFHYQKLADTLKIWEEDPVYIALLQDKVTTVDGMTFAEWVEYAEHSATEHNQ